MIGDLLEKWIKERPLLRRFFDRGIIMMQTGIDDMVRKKKEEWAKKGVDPLLIEKAVELALKWAESLSKWHIAHLEDVLPSEELAKIEKQIFIRYVENGLNKVAEEWIKAMYR